MKAEYPGPNAEHISEQLASLAQAWHELQDAALLRRNNLLAAYDLQRFLTKARDFITWTEIATSEMQGDQTIHDLQSAEWIHKEHARLKAEIDARDDEYIEVRQLGAELVNKNHYAKAEIEVKLNQVVKAYSHVKSEWGLREQWLSQVVEWHAFHREAKQTIALISSREQTLKSFDTGTSVEAVESQIKKLETAVKALGQVDERIQAIDATAKQLIERKHMESPNIDQWNKKVESARQQLHTTVNLVRKRLETALALAKYNFFIT